MVVIKDAYDPGFHATTPDELILPTLLAINSYIACNPQLHQKVKMWKLLTPWNAGVAAKCIVVGVFHYGNSWSFVVTQGVKGRASPAMQRSSPAENPLTIALSNWSQPPT